MGAMSFVNVGFATPSAVAIVGTSATAENATARNPTGFHVARILRTPLPSKSFRAPMQSALLGVEIIAIIAETLPPIAIFLGYRHNRHARRGFPPNAAPKGKERHPRLRTPD